MEIRLNFDYTKSFINRRKKIRKSNMQEVRILERYNLLWKAI